MGGEARLREGDDCIAHLEVDHAGADRGDPAGDFEAEPRTGETILQDFLREHGERPKHVAEVEAGGRHCDLDRAGAGRNALGRTPDHLVETAGVGALQLGCRSRIAAQPRRAAGMEADHAGGVGIENDLGLGRAREDQCAQPLRRELRRQGRGQIDPANVEIRRFVGEGAAEGPNAGLDGGGLATRVAGRAGGDHPETGLAVAEMLGAALEAEAPIAQARRGLPVRRVFLSGEGTGQEHHGVGGFTLQFQQRLLGIENDRDVDAARDQQSRQRGGGFGAEGIVRADDEGEALAMAGDRPGRGLGDEQQVAAIGRDGPVGRDAHEAGGAERPLPSRDIRKPRERLVGHDFAEPVRAQSEDEVAEQRGAGLDGDQKTAGGERSTDPGGQVRLGSVKDIAREHQIEGVGRQIVGRLGHADPSGEAEPRPFGQAAIGFEHSERRTGLARQRSRTGRERAEADLQDAQGAILGQALAAALDDLGDGGRAGTGGRAAQVEGVEGGGRQARRGDRLTRKQARDEGGGVGQQHQLRGELRVVRRDPTHRLFRGGQGHVPAQVPGSAIATARLVGRKSAALQCVEGVHRPRTQDRRQPRVGEIDRAVAAQSFRETVGERRRPSLQQQMARTEFGIVRGGRRREGGAQTIAEDRSPFQRQGRRLGGEFARLGDGERIEIASALGPQGLEPALADGGDHVALGVEEREVGQDRAFVAATGPDLRPRDHGARPQQADLAEAHGYIRLGGALTHQLGEEQDQSVEARIEAGRHEAVARVRFCREQFRDDGGLVDPRGSRDLPEAFAEAES